MSVSPEQRSYFAVIPHERRFAWQTQDSFVCKREHEVLRPLFDILKHALHSSGHRLNVLECGCGEGVNIIHLVHLGAGAEDFNFVGIDPDDASVETAQRHGVEAVIGNGLTLPFPAGSFDVVFCRDVLHHLPDIPQRTQFIDEMRRVLAPGGFVVVIEPNPCNVALFAFSLFVHAERGVRAMGEGQMRNLMPSARVIRVSPSVAWRIGYHYRSPILRWPMGVRCCKAMISMWEWVCRHLPSLFWAYRCYVWQTEVSR